MNKELKTVVEVLLMIVESDFVAWKLVDAIDKKEQAVKSGDYEEAISMRIKERALRSSLPNNSTYEKAASKLKKLLKSIEQ